MGTATSIAVEPVAVVGVEHERFVIDGGIHPQLGALELHGDVHVRCDAVAKPAIIICHGFKGFKDWGAFPYLRDRLADAGFYCVGFNFALNGIGSDIFSFTELEKFKWNTYRHEADDLRRIIRALGASALPFATECDRDSIGLVGHSRGGAAAICIGAEEASVRAVVGLASISFLGTVNAELEAKWRRDGVRYVENMRTGQQMPLGLDLLEDLLSDPDRVEKAARRLSKPFLAIHGESDTAVPHHRAKDLASWAPEGKSLLIPGADHTFGARHPFAGSTDHFEMVINVLVEFFKAAL